MLELVLAAVGVGATRSIARCGNIPPVEIEALYYETQKESAMEAGLSYPSLWNTRGESVNNVLAVLFLAESDRAR